MGLFESFKRGLAKTRDFWAAEWVKTTASHGKFDQDMLDELEELMVRADCGVAASEDVAGYVKDYIKRTGDDSHDGVMNAVKERIVEILGEKQVIDIEDGKLNIILMVGANGTGKTTTAGKLALKYKSEGKRVLLAAADTFRAAAVDQLKEWGARTETAVISHEEGSDPASVVYDAVQAAKARKTDVLIVDTAGRLHNKKNLMDELSKINRIIEREAPDANKKSLLIIDANTGQNGIDQASVFKDCASITGIVITKMDGTSKGGIILSIRDRLALPVKFIGLGEKMDDLEEFDLDKYLYGLLIGDEEDE